MMCEWGPTLALLWVPTSMKQCMACGREPPDIQFAQYTSGPCKGKDRNRCTECWSKYRRQNRLDNLSSEQVAKNKKRCTAYHAAHRDEQNTKSKARYATKYVATRGVDSAAVLSAFWAENEGLKKTCSRCGKSLSVRKHFYVRVKLGVLSVREHCKKCHVTLSLQARSLKPAGAIWSRYKKSAKQRGLEFGITKQDVEAAIAQSCTYCGEDSILMTLDRVENTIGYVPDNVVPCCIRCNIMKADMPKDAWLQLAPQVRAVREAGLFLNWIGRAGFASKTRATP